MKIILLTSLLVIYSSQLFAIQAPTDRGEFCNGVEDRDFFQDLILEEENRLSFRNRGGLLNSGVCRWHSRFNRNALYLSIWKPELPRPTIKGRRKLVERIRKGLNVITIPGYHNLNEFSVHNKELIQTELEKWQRIDSVFKNRWLDGAFGLTKMPRKVLKWHMDRIYRHYSNRDGIIFLRAQIKGIASHSLLLTKMEKKGKGYVMTVIDSNMEKPTIIEYQYGMKYFKYFGKRYIPYLQFRPELQKLKLLQKKYCY